MKAKKPQKEKRPVGRPKGSGTVFNDEVRKNILAVIQTGGSRNDAADYVGVGRSTLVDEIRRNHEFAEQVSRAEASGKIKHIKKISDSDDWRASAEFLKMKYPEEFANSRARIDHTSSDGSMSPDSSYKDLLLKKFGKKDDEA